MSDSNLKHLPSSLQGPELFELVYEELRCMAAARLIREKPGQTLSATALVHEVYLRLFGQSHGVSFANRRQFFAAATESMRRILIDVSRRKHSRKRAGDRVAIDLESLCSEPLADPDLIMEIDQQLIRLNEIDPEVAELVRLRLYVGANMAEAATILDRPQRSTERLWTYARAWLARELKDFDRARRGDY